MHLAKPVLLWSELQIWSILWLLRLVFITSQVTEYEACCAEDPIVGHLQCRSRDTATRKSHDAQGSRHRMKSKRNLYATRYILHIKVADVGDSSKARQNPMPLGSTNPTNA
jgi:hypothetical protein